MPASIAGDTWPGVLAAYAVLNVGSSCALFGLRLHENVLLGRRGIWWSAPRYAETLVPSRSSFVATR